MDRLSYSFSCLTTSDGKKFDIAEPKSGKSYHGGLAPDLWHDQDAYGAVYDPSTAKYYKSVFEGIYNL